MASKSTHPIETPVHVPEASAEQNSSHAILMLQSEVIDQIAAGEVVERPAHLVKELVENAIDAGAGAIEVEHDQGGRRVRVTDDGIGIDRDQLVLALARHATSKLLQADDLWRLHTYGFRGEALASIGAVSKLSLLSRISTSDTAFRICTEFGRTGEVEPIGANFGTTVVIEDLFANLPARLKFLKSEAGESAQIKSTLRALALANESIEFRVRTKGKLDSIWPKAATFLERAKGVLGMDHLFIGEHEHSGVKAQVAFASPHDIAGNTRSILLFVNGRWVQDRGLQAAVIDAYRGLLMHGEYPIAIVRVQAPPAEVDVNIHPTKSQIKFRDTQAAFRAVHRALREGLERAPWLERPAIPEEALAPARKMTVGELTRPYDPGSTAQIDHQPVASALSALLVAPEAERFSAPEFDTIVFRQTPDPVFKVSLQPGTRVADSKPEGGRALWSRLQILGQANLTYIVAQDERGLVFVDQHAAHERVAYERLMRSWSNGASQGNIDMQTLLLPLTIELEPDGPETLLSIAPELERVGVHFDQVGPQAIAVRTKPALISDRALSKVLLELAHEMLERGGSFVFEKKIGDLCATMACHSVVRAGQSLSHEQMRSLLVQMDEFALSSFCPHGRPVSVDYPFATLERDFGRIV